jgi:hypothetical protein
MLPGSPLAAFCPEPVARNGFSLARNGCLLSVASIPGSKLPACYFASFQVRFRARSTLRLHYRCCRFAPVAAASLPLARCASTTRFGLPRPRSPLPSGIFTSLGIEAFNRVCRLPVHLTNPPDLLSLPAARPGKSWGNGSTFQVRYVSAGLLFLKPLGTFFTMLPMASSVNANRRETRFFPQHLIDLFSSIWCSRAEHLL